MVSAQGGVINRIEADDVEPYAPVVPLDDEVQDLVVDAGVVSEVLRGAPLRVPSGVEQQEVRLTNEVAVWSEPVMPRQSILSAMPTNRSAGNSSSLVRSG